MVDYLRLSGDEVQVGSPTENDFVFASGELVNDTDDTRYAFISGRGFGGASEGQVSRWAFEDPSDTDYAIDSWGDNDGVNFDATYTSNAKVGSYALDFNGSSNYVAISHSSELDIITGTYAGWINIDQFTNNYDQYVLHKGTQGQKDTDEGIIGLFIDDGGRAGIRIGEGGSDTWPSEYGWGPSDGWVHLCGTIDESKTVKFYINGNQVDSATTTASPDTEQGWMIGTHINLVGEHSHYTDGRIDEVRIYDRALSSSEVSALANQ